MKRLIFTCLISIAMYLCIVLASCAPIAYIHGHNQDGETKDFEARYYGGCTDTIYYKKQWDGTFEQSYTPTDYWIVIETVTFKK